MKHVESAEETALRSRSDSKTLPSFELRCIRGAATQYLPFGARAWCADPSVSSGLTKNNVVIVIRTKTPTKVSLLVWGVSLRGGAVALAQFNFPPVRYAGQEDFLYVSQKMPQITQFPPKTGKKGSSQAKIVEKYLIYSLFII